jgi:hypothetical protein
MYRLQLRHALVAVALLGTFAFLADGRAQAQPPGSIQVVFTNRTDQRVTFFLNGGAGLETRLDAGQSQTYTMVVDAGVPPTVKIYQPSGGPRTFTVANGGRYAFRYKNGQIYNFFD